MSKQTSTLLESLHALFAVIDHPQTRIIYKQEAPEVVKILLIYSPSAAAATVGSTRKEFEALLKSILISK